MGVSEKSKKEQEELLQRALQYKEKAETLGKGARRAFRGLRSLSSEKRNDCLLTLSGYLRDKSNTGSILKANRLDIDNGKKQGLSESLIERLELNPKRIEDMARALEEIAALPDPIGEVLQGKKLPNGIELIQKRVPLGVIFTIYESRPNVTIDVGALCIKSANCAILRGGKEARETNLLLFSLFRQAMRQAGLPEEALEFVDDPDRAFMLSLLWQENWIDLVVPRGGEQLIRFISMNSRIPVVKHDKGVCSLYIDKSADFSQALALTQNSKLQRTSVCNAIENLIIHKDFPKSSKLLGELAQAGVQLLGCPLSKRACSEVTLIPEEEIELEYAKEYLDKRLSVKVVANIDEALDFIFSYGSGHSEGIVSEDMQSIHYFQENVDTAAVFVNCSTRFHDGGQMGFGAEVGISTGRLHVRGPMSLRDLSTTTYVLSGVGQIRQ